MGGVTTTSTGHTAAGNIKVGIEVGVLIILEALQISFPNHKYVCSVCVYYMSCEIKYPAHLGKVCLTQPNGHTTLN